jgi:hypothetical protein
MTCNNVRYNNNNKDLRVDCEKFPDWEPDHEHGNGIGKKEIGEVEDRTGPGILVASQVLQQLVISIGDMEDSHKKRNQNIPNLA